jgi:hypothetical protein
MLRITENLVDIIILSIILCNRYKCTETCGFLWFAERTFSRYTVVKSTIVKEYRLALVLKYRPAQERLRELPAQRQISPNPETGGVFEKRDC